jgi:hypothetical protein
MPDRYVLPLPTSIEEIDRDWVNAALRRRYQEVTVRAVEIVDIKHGTCTKIRLRLDVDEAGKRAGIPETVILKGGFEPHSREMDYMHEVEVRAYADILPTTGLPHPKSYFAEFDAERRQGIVIMEDLVARGVHFCSPLRPQTHEQVRARLTLLARHHAKTWNTPELAPGGRWEKVPDTLVQTKIHFATYFKEAEWQRFVDSPRGAAASVRFHSIAWMKDAVERMAALAEREPHCIVHGDTHLGNLYIDPDGTPGFFDPVPHHAPSMVEISYHMACALDTADRQRWEGSLVQHYLDELAGCGVTPPSFDDAMRQYGIFLALGYLIFIVNESFFQTEAINTAYTARFSAAMIDHDTIGLLRTI